MSPHGIPTEYNALRFRSRLEATWARFFDAMEWPWKYEPFDYEGYIPDFVLLMPHGNILVEVKPELSLTDLRRHTSPIDRSPWEKEALVLGVGLVIDPDVGYPGALGLHGHFDYWHHDGSPRQRAWERADLHRCACCHHASFHSVYGSYHCRWRGCHDGDGYLVSDAEGFGRTWHLAQNLVQWAPRTFGAER